MRLILAIVTALTFAPCFGQPVEGVRRINGTDLYLRIDGQGDYLLIIHGGPGLNHSYFRPYLDPLNKSFTLVYYDQRASGQSAIPSPDSISLKFFIEDIEGIRKMLGVDKLNLLAHSWGSVPAAKYCLAYPDHVKKLILSNPAPLSKEYDAEMAAFVSKHMSKDDSVARAAILSSQNFSVGNITELMKINFRSSAYDKNKIDHLNINLPSNLNEANRALFTGLGNDLSSFNFYNDISKFNFPVLIIEGKYDGIPKKSIERLKRSIPRSNVIVFKKSGHFPFLEEQHRYANIIRSFLNK